MLATRSAYFGGLFNSGTGMSEGAGSAVGKDIVIKEVSAGVFRVLLSFCMRTCYQRVKTVGKGLDRLRWRAWQTVSKQKGCMSTA